MSIYLFWLLTSRGSDRSVGLKACTLTSNAYMLTPIPYFQVCPRDFIPTLLRWVDAESLPEYLGGTSKATLLDDAGPWQDPKVLAQVSIHTVHLVFRRKRMKIKITPVQRHKFVSAL